MTKTKPTTAHRSIVWLEMRRDGLWWVGDLRMRKGGIVLCSTGAWNNPQRVRVEAEAWAVERGLSLQLGR